MSESDILALIAVTPGWNNPNRRALLAQLRYRRCPARRLAQINRVRARRGKPLAASVDHVAIRLPA